MVRLQTKSWTSIIVLIPPFAYNGAPIALKYRTGSDNGAYTSFFFEKNLQGDIIAIYDESGTKIGAYTYDAWGNTTYTLTSGNTALENSIVRYYNPFRYRGYFYDVESQLYYLQSRYYNPAWYRFINADALSYLGQDGDLLCYNLYAYCGNNPVMGYDPTGHWDWGGVVIGLGIIAATVVTVATFGVATPVGGLIATAAIVTGTAMTYAAATDSTMVIDMSISHQVDETYGKTGGSIVIDFKNDEANFYTHCGIGVGVGDGLSYSVGLVSNYDEPSDYALHFVDVNAGNKIGIDHCWNPMEDYNTATKATSITFSSSYGGGIGYDFYSNAVGLFSW